MDKGNSSQLELFSQVGQEGSSQKNQSTSFFGYMKNYEKALLLLIGFILTAVVAFSLGVQQGKTMAMPVTPTAVAKQPVVTAVSPALNTPVSKPQVALTTTPLAAQSVRGIYTVQLASFKTSALAEREGRILQKKGITAILINKGTYTILCAGKYADKTKALSAMTQFKKQYKDCTLRRL